METLAKNDRLNIACGHRTMKGYDNVDINASLPNLTFIASMESIPVPDESYVEVFASHCLEHVPFQKGKICLREWLRVLKKDGLLIVDTPCLERNINLYINNTWQNDFNNLTPAEKEKCSFNHTPNKTLWLNFKIFSSDVQWDLHYANYDSDLLVKFCLDAGFSSAIVRQTDSSLIVHATK